MRRELVGLGLLALSACTGAGPGPRSGSEGADQAEGPRLEPGMPLYGDELRLLIDDVARMRGLARRGPIPIDAVDQEELERGYDAETRWLRVDPESPHDEADLLSRNLAGYYDPGRGRVFVRSAGPSSKSESLPWRMSLAHEIQHALQHQHFGPPVDVGQTEDERLAHRALREGDAEVTGRLYGAALQALARSRALRELIVRRHAEDSLVDGPLPGAGEAQVRMWFPYVSGAAFAADLVRAHGFGLVDTAHGRPPTSTEQILHPNKYLGGEQPAQVPAPPIPPGHRSVEIERLGELGTRLLLAPCVDDEEAWRAAEGWGGDSLRTVEGAAGQRARLWSSAWDSPEDARELERALGGGPCREDRLVVRRGTRVVMVEGLDRGRRDKLAAAILRQKVDRPADEPLGPWRVPDLAPVAERRPGSIRGGRYRSAWLGLVSRLPPGAAATLAPDEGGAAPTELSVRSEDGGVGMVFLWPYGPTPEHTTAIVDHFRSGMKDLGESFRHAGTEVVGAPLGGGSALAFDGLHYDLRLLLVPVCRHTGTLVIARVLPKQAAFHPLDDWVEGLAWQGGASPPMCSFLDPG